MHDTGKQLLRLMFQPGETVCVSHNQYGFHSVSLEKALDGAVTLVPREETAEKLGLDLKDAIERIDSSQLTMCALNPIEGFRVDENCTAFRNFLIELDYGPMTEQLAYVKKIGMPYSAVIFSGNKSLHFLISLDTDLPSENVWRIFAEWILGIATMADQNTKNPSRSIRIPGAYREPKKRQLMLPKEFKGKVKLEDLTTWLSLHPDAKPREKEVRVIPGERDLSKVSPWVANRLINGLDPTKGRNQQWFAISCEFALSGFSEFDTIDILSEFFVEERDFKRREWEATVASGFKHAYNKK